MSNRSAAGLRRSAIVARIRLREEWSELKGPEEPSKSLKLIPEIIRKNQKPVRSASKLVAQKVKYTKKSPSNVLKSKNQNIMTSKVPISERNMDSSTDALRGVVALVDVGTETRALALRAALMALGATVVPTWSPFVTHLVWTEGGCRATRAKARALACRLVSPLWVEACAACGRRVAEAAFPAASRASDLPSPRALRIMLKRAETENIPLADLLNANNNKEPDNNPKQRLRISSENETDTSADRTDTTHDTSTDQDTSHDRSGDTTDPTVRVNTLPRGGHKSPPQHPKSRRKLFTHKEGQDLTNKHDDDTPAVPKRAVPKVTQRERKELARAERMARKMLGASTPAKTQTQQILAQTDAHRIVLTGMSRTERQAVQAAIKILNGRVQKYVNHRTTHVVLGSCLHSENQNQLDTTGIHPLNQTKTSCTCTKDPSHCSEMRSINKKIPSINTPKSQSINTRCIESITSQFARCAIDKARTLNALLGAARGCRIVYAQWIADSLEVKKWLHHHGYEVKHLRKISQKARVERTALGRTCSDYAYDVFKGMRVRVSPDADQRPAAIQLLKLCGGVAIDGATVNDLQDGAGQSGSQNGAGQSSVVQSGLRIGICQSGLQRGAGQSGLQIVSCQSGLQRGAGQRDLQNGAGQIGAVQSGLHIGICQSGLQRGARQSGLQNGAGQIGAVQSGLQIGTVQSGLQRGAGQSGLQNGGSRSVDFDICLGNSEGEISSKWVFDSVAAGRMRTTRRYVNLAGD